MTRKIQLRIQWVSDRHGNCRKGNENKAVIYIIVCQVILLQYMGCISNCFGEYFEMSFLELVWEQVS